MQGGIFILNLLDEYVSSHLIPWIGVAEMATLVFGYGETTVCEAFSGFYCIRVFDVFNPPFNGIQLCSYGRKKEGRVMSHPSDCTVQLRTGLAVPSCSPGRGGAVARRWTGLPLGVRYQRVADTPAPTPNGGTNRWQ